MPITPLDLQPIEAPGLRDVASSDATLPAGQVSFGDELSRAVEGVDSLQIAADREAEKAALGGGNLHELSLSLEKADVAMRVATKVRNKLVEAYHDVMRMNV